MSKFPFLPIDVDSYFSDTRHLTTEQHGAYFLLLMEAWRRPNCTLPDDDTILAPLAGVSVERWREIKSPVMAFWTLDNRSHGWTQKRLKKERKYVAERKAKKRDAAASRWNKKKKGDASAYAVAMPPSPSPSLNEGNNPKSKVVVTGNWFEDWEVEFLEAQHQGVPVRAKIEDPSFRQWCERTRPSAPTDIAKQTFAKLSKQREAERNLIEAKKAYEKVELGDMSHLAEALDKRKH